MGVGGWMGDGQCSPGRPAAAAAGRGGVAWLDGGMPLGSCPHIWLGLHSWDKEVLTGARSSGVASIRRSRVSYGGRQALV